MNNYLQASGGREEKVYQTLGWTTESHEELALSFILLGIWCFQTVVLEKTLESPLDCEEIKPVNPKENQSWIFIGRTDAEAETPILWPPDVKSWLIVKDPDAGKDWRQEEKGTNEDEMVEWHHRLSGQTPGDGEGQGSLACCSPWGHRVGHDWATEQQFLGKPSCPSFACTCEITQTRAVQTHSGPEWKYYCFSEPRVSHSLQSGSCGAGERGHGDLGCSISLRTYLFSPSCWNYSPLAVHHVCYFYTLGFIVLWFIHLAMSYSLIAL